MTPLNQILYTANVTATAGRAGSVRSDDGALDLSLSVPKGLGGPGGAGTNPEQLFAAGYAACFGGAFGLVARKAGVETGAVEISAQVSIGPIPQGFGLAVALKVSAPALPKEQVEALAKAAHEVCPYSNATRGNIDVQVDVA